MDESKLKKQETVANLPKIYALLPLLPLILILVVGIAAMVVPSITMDVFILTFISFIVAIIFETIRTKELKSVVNASSEMFIGMGEGFGRVVILVVGGSLFTSGIQALGVIDSLTNAVQHTSSAGLVTMVIFALATCLFGILSGGGLAMFYAVIAMIPGIAATAGVQGMLITLPMQMIANLSRTISPVAAVIMIVASTVGVSLARILKRTAVPTIVAIALVMVLAVVLLPY